MTESTNKRRSRQQYSKLICLGCRARRIRCALPDTSIEPSAEAQPADKACQRCRNNGLACVVDYTTLGRPAQKRSRDHDANANARQQAASTSTTARETSASSQLFGDEAAEGMDGFLVTQPDLEDDESGLSIEKTATTSPRPQRPSKSELYEAMKSSFHLLAALLSRDKTFASAIGSQPMVQMSIIELIDGPAMELLDELLVWHRLLRPDIPYLPRLRKEIAASEPGQPQWTSGTYLLTLLCDLALDVPSPRIASLRTLQPAVRALVYHTGQKLFFSLSRNDYTVLALCLTAQYRPLALTSSQAASTDTLKAIPHIVMAKYVAAELGYAKAGRQLTEALNNPELVEADLKPLMIRCSHWIGLSVSEDVQTGPFSDWVRRIEPSAIECLDALRTAVLLDRLPVEMVVIYAVISYNTQMLANLRDMTEQWKDLGHLEQVIHGHQLFCENEKKSIDRVFERTSSSVSAELVSVVTHLEMMERHLTHTMVVSFALFFSIMYAAHGKSQLRSIEYEHAAGVSDYIIGQLRSHSEEDPHRPEPRKFLERYGADSMDELEKVLTNFITAVDTLRLNGVAYVARTRDTVGWILMVCKDIVEGNAARLKGWGGLHDRVDVQLILLKECARRLESMSATAGNEVALAKGCLLTGTAKLIRSLHRILQGFKRQAALTTSARAASSVSTATNAMLTPEGSDGVSSTSQLPPVGAGGLDELMTEDLFNDWANWPQMDTLDFSDMLANGVEFDFGS